MDRIPTLALALASSASCVLGAAIAPSDARSEAKPAASVASAPLTLAEAQDRALRGNPGLGAMAAAVRAADGAWQQARALPNPELSIGIDGIGGSVPEPAEEQTIYSLEQVLEIGGKRGARSRERELARTVTEGDAEIGRRDLLAEVKRRFVRVLGLQERARILEEALRTAETVQSTVRELVVAGEVSPIEEMKAEGDASLARIDLRAAASELAVARRELAATWGERAPDFGSVSGDLEALATIPERDELEKRIASLPDIARGDADAARLAAALDLEEKKRIPDLTLSAGVQQYRAFGDRAFVAGVKIPLPIFDRNAGAIAEASSRLEQGRRERSAAEARVATSLAAAYERLTASALEVETLRDTVLPRARQVLDGVAEGYRRGKFRLLELLDARRSLAAAELRYNEALVSFNLAEADVERWSGPSESGSQGEVR